MLSACRTREVLADSAGRLPWLRAAQAAERALQSTRQAERQLQARATRRRAPLVAACGSVSVATDGLLPCFDFLWVLGFP